MNKSRTATQTSDAAGGAERRGPRAPRLVRFFRADDPYDAFDEFPLSGRVSWKLGRVDARRADAPAASDQIWSAGDAQMSSKHATLKTTHEGSILTDAGSKNGTFVNGARLAGGHLLHDRDIVQLGSSFFIYLETEGHRPASSNEMPRGEPLSYQVDPLRVFAASDLSIHLHGETGTGKDVIARAVHDLSGRSGNFVARNCAAIPDNLFESELFGYAKGAFSGASSAQQGQIQAAAGGTLFLDEIGELSLAMQAKLLRVLELKEVQPLGASTPIAVDFRLISATLCDLEALVGEGRFRRDLLARLGRSFHVPPLRAHKEHLGRLVQRWLAGQSARAVLHAPVRFKIEAARAIVQHSWPLNVRELKHCIESAFTAAIAGGIEDGSYAIELGHLPRSVTAVPTATWRGPAERERKGKPSDDDVIAGLRTTRGNRAEAAKVLGLSERTIFRRVGRLRQRGIKV